MILKVNPTRVNLLSLKKRLKTAKKGHKLLKDKRDGLIQKFMSVIRETQELRSRVDNDLSAALHSYVQSSSMVNEKILDTAFLLPGTEISLSVSTSSVMSVSVPKFRVQKTGQSISYGFLETNAEIDNAVKKLSNIFQDLLRLAELEKTIENLADEIEKTRRRTNALENIMIPNLKDTIRYINIRLEEQQRDAVVLSMRIKDMIMEKSV